MTQNLARFKQAAPIPSESCYLGDSRRGEPCVFGHSRFGDVELKKNPPACAAKEFRRLKGDLTGAALIAALQASPYREIDIEPRRERLPVRDVKL